MGLPRLRFGNDGDFFGGLVKKDIERLNALKTAYDEQKYRVVKLLEYDSKRIGIKRLAKEMGVEWSYLYRIFKGGYVSHEKIQELYLIIDDFKKRLGVHDD